MNAESKSGLGISDVEKLMPQEEMLEAAPHYKKVIIGVPEEISKDEKRVALIPDAVRYLVDNGNKVIVEEGSGSESNFSDQQYSEAGAQIVSSPEEVYKSDIIVKVGRPTESEIDMAGNNKVMLSSLYLPTAPLSYIKKLMSNRIVAVAYELIQGRKGILPVMKSVSEIVGTTAVLIASQLLKCTESGKGKLLGGFPGISPSKVVIIGSGTVAQSAARTALGMGAQIMVFDDSIDKLRLFQNRIGHTVATSTMNPGLLDSELAVADVVISAKFSNEGYSPCIISEESVRKMEEGSIIIDVSIDQGGCFETSRPTTHSDPVYKVHGVTHYCVPNIASSVPNTASVTMSNVLLPYINKIVTLGGIDAMLRHDVYFRRGVYMYNGTLTNSFIGSKYGLPSRDLELLMAAFR